MKMKYVLEKGGNNELTIREFSALDKKNQELYSLLCESRYEGETIEEAISKGERAVISALRTPSLYPPRAYMGRIAQTAVSMYGPEAQESAELYFDDNEILANAQNERDALESIDEEIEEDEGQIDELLTDSSDITNIKTTIQVADEEEIDIEKENDKLIEE